MTEQPRPGPRPRPTPDDPPAETVTAPPPRTRRPRTFAVVAVLVLGLIALNIWLWTVRSDNSDSEQARTDALESAKQRVPALLSYDYRKLSSYVRTAPDNATGRFRTDFAILVEKVIAPAARQKQITTVAVVKEAGIVDAGPDQVTVLVLLDQRTTSKTVRKGQLDGSRDRVVMRKVGGSWLIAELTPV